METFNWLNRPLLLAMFALAAACGSSSSPAGPSSPPEMSPAGQFTLQGDPGSRQGATWTYQGTVEGVTVDLRGILLKPQGSGVFPAIVISHGAGGSVNGYSRAMAIEMVQWGLVCIATNYTHAAGVPQGAPGASNEAGASHANIVRGRAAYEILRALGYVDMTRVAAHGHSMGAFVTAALVGAYPRDFRAASHTAGGVRLGGASGVAPTESQVSGLMTPYQLHHGDADVVVPLAMDERFAALLRGAGVISELHVYPGASHEDVSRNTVVLGSVRAWYATHGMF